MKKGRATIPAGRTVGAAEPILKKTHQWKWNHANIEARRAHNAVRGAVKKGLLKRGKCEVCGSFRVDGHHDDYSKPLEVRWLCRKHHRAFHAALKRAA